MNVHGKRTAPDALSHIEIGNNAETERQGGGRLNAMMENRNDNYQTHRSQKSCQSKKKKRLVLVVQVIDDCWKYVTPC